MKTIGFIILRHVSDKYTDQYWKLSYESIRKKYPENQILIIDDDSNYDLLDKEYEKKIYKTKIINSEYKNRGELLPYYYFISNKLFDIAVIIHDSVFINHELDFNVKTHRFIWNFEHTWDQEEDEINMIKQLNNNEDLLDFYPKKHLWKGCFGGMTIITHDYLKAINDKYNLSKLLPYIKSRYRRMSFERVIGCVLQKNSQTESLLDDIHQYGIWGLQFKDFEDIEKLHFPIVKVWSGR